MPRIKISQLPETASLTPTDLLTAVADFTSSKITVRHLSNSLTKVTASIMADTASSADNFNVRNNLYGTDAYFTGTINANTLKVSIVSSSVVYSSGSNIFGDDASDTQQFSGSVLIRDSVVIPRFSSNPGGAQEGQLYYNTVDANVYRYTSTGWQSAAGSSGSSGSSGQNGAAGSSGTSGESGASGASGSSGTSGQSGASGANGSSGSSGTSGTGFSTISSAENLRVLTSDGSPNAATAQTNLRFDGTTLQVTGSLAVGTIVPSLTPGRIDAGNDIVAFSTSDQRLKTDVTPIENAIEKVKSINGVNFTWIENIEVHGNSGRDIGVIAQEIEAVLPEVVTTRDSGYKAVKYEKIIPLLIEAIKDLQKQIEELKASK